MYFYFRKTILFLFILGLNAPIYGITLGFLKLSLFRIGLIVSLIYLISSNINNLKINKIFIYFFLFLIARFISSLLTFNFDSFNQWIWFFEGVLFLFFMYNFLIINKDDLRFFLFVNFIIGLISIIFIVIQGFLFLNAKIWAIPFSIGNFGMSPSSIENIDYPLGTSGRIIGLFLDPNITGSFLLFFYILYLTNPNIIFNKPNKTFNLFLILLILIALIFTGSRQNIIIFMIIMSINYFSFNHLNNFLKIIFSLSFFLFFLYFVFLKIDISDWLNIFLLRFNNDEVDFTSGRLTNTYNTLFNLDFKTFVIGYGEGHYGDKLSSSEVAPHNGFLFTLIESGLLGLISLIYLLFKLFSLISVDNYDYSRISKYILFSWIILIFINWAQLNQGISFLYIAIILLFNKFRFNNFSKL
jgi:hypothetical protein